MAFRAGIELKADELEDKRGYGNRHPVASFRLFLSVVLAMSVATPRSKLLNNDSVEPISLGSQAHQT